MHILSKELTSVLKSFDLRELVLWQGTASFLKEREEIRLYSISKIKSTPTETHHILPRKILAAAAASTVCNCSINPFLSCILNSSFEGPWPFLAVLTWLLEVDGIAGGAQTAFLLLYITASSASLRLGLISCRCHKITCIAFQIPATNIFIRYDPSW